MINKKSPVLTNLILPLLSLFSIGGLAVTLGFMNEQEVKAADTYSKLTSLANINESSQYVLGIDGTGFHYSGISNWGLLASPSTQTPLYYSLSVVNAELGTFRAKTTISATEYYLTVPISNDFALSTLATTIKLSSNSYSSGDTSAINHATTSGRHLRLNGTSGIRSYAGTTGVLVFFYEVVPSKLLTQIDVSGTPNKTTYYEGESFVPTGLTIMATYDDDSTQNVTTHANTTYTPNPLLAGTTSVTVAYTYGAISKTSLITGISVSAVVLNGISIKTAAAQTTFTLGEDFNHNGLTITADYNSGAIDVSAGFSVSGVDTMRLGLQTATIEYEGEETTYTIVVTNNGALVGDVALASELIISEYIEGSGNNKVIELFNGTGNVIDLSAGNYALSLYANGAGSATATLSLSGTIAHGTVLSVVHTSATSSFKISPYITDQTVMGFNGDDALALRKNNIVIDVIGTIGSDPGTQWTGTAANGSGSTLDKTLVRLPSITSPTTTFTWSQWNVYDVDTASYLGSHDVSSGDVTTLEQATAFAEYVMTGIGLNAAGNCAAVLDSLLIEYGFMDATSQLEFDTNPDEIFINARARLSYLASWSIDNPADPGSGTLSQNTNNGTIDENIIWLALLSFIGFGGAIAHKLTQRQKHQ